MLEFLNRLRNFDPKKLTPAQIALGIVAIIVVLAVLNFILNLANTLLPFILVGAALYFGYNWLSSRSEAMPQRKSRNQRVVEEAEKARGVVQTTAVMSEEASDTVDERYQDVQEVARNAPVANLTDHETSESEEERRLRVEQVVNPETGFKEPNISRLIEQEEEKLRDMDKVNDDVLAQIEERRRRLLSQKGNDESSS